MAGRRDVGSELKSLRSQVAIDGRGRHLRTDRRIPVFPIGVVKNLTGLSERQIRYYDQAGLVVPNRTKGNQRLYSEADVERLLEVKSLLERGLCIEEISEHLARKDRDAGRTSVDPRICGDARFYFGARGAGRLDSLYPVSDRAELMRAIDDKTGGR